MKYSKGRSLQCNPPPSCLQKRVSVHTENYSLHTCGFGIWTSILFWKHVAIDRHDDSLAVTISLCHVTRVHRRLGSSGLCCSQNSETTWGTWQSSEPVSFLEIIALWEQNCGNLQGPITTSRRTQIKRTKFPSVLFTAGPKTPRQWEASLYLQPT